MLSWAWGAIVVGAVIVPADVPAGSDLLLRLEGGFTAQFGEAVEELRPALEAWPGLTRLVDASDGRWSKAVLRVLAVQGADLGARRATLTVAVDLDAAGGLTWSALARGALGKRTALAPVDGEELYEVDGQAAARLPGLDLAWSVTAGGVLVVGDERGLQRHLRHLLGALPPDELLHPRAGQVRKAAPLLLVFVLPPSVRQGWAKELPWVGPLVGEVTDGHLSATATEARLALGTSEGSQGALLHGVRALVAASRGVPAVLEGLGEGLQALEGVGAWPQLQPATLDETSVATLTREWVGGFTLSDKIGTRPPGTVTAELAYAKPRALLIGLLVLGARLESLRTPLGLEEAQALLTLLRQKQLAFKKKTGAYLTCGPVPPALPTDPLPWPKGSCFDQLGFAPEGEVRLQLFTTVEEGRLTLAGRSDLDGDGLPELWVLEEGQTKVRRLAVKP